MTDREARRQALQVELDGHKTQRERNRLGQFATPAPLARAIVEYGLDLLPAHAGVHFLDPALGTGSFYSALASHCGRRHLASARGFEIDPHYGEAADALWRETLLDVTLADFTRLPPPTDENAKANLLICNPPYVRHHHLEGEQKIRLQLAARRANVKLSGLAGLYCYFMALAHAWMREGGIAGWLVPSEFMDVNYGREVKQYLLREVTLLHVHRFDPHEVQFDDALVSSAVVWFKKERPPLGHEAAFSYGGSLREPATKKLIDIGELTPAAKWTQFPRTHAPSEHNGYRLGDLFTIKRGLATGDNSFFILDEARARSLNLPRQFLRPVLPGTRHLKVDEILGDADGVPLLDKRLFLLDCDLPPDELERDHPDLWKYLQAGADSVASGYLCRSRRLWYSQEKRHAAPIVFTYLGRSDGGRPFRFLLNRSKATATNVYLMLYPRPLLAARLEREPDILRKLWQGLNAIDPETLLGSGRVYGGGLHKLEPKELGSVPADDIAQLAGLEFRHCGTQQLSLG